MVWRTENQQRSYLQPCSWPLALILQNTLLRDMHGLQKWKQLHQNLSGDYLSAFVSHQLFPKGGWAGTTKRGTDFWGRCRSQRTPKPSTLGQPASPAAVWFGAFSDLGTQSSFSRLVCAHTCRPAFSVESHHSTKKLRTQEKPCLKEKVLSEWDVPESRILFLISDWKALLNSPVSNGKHCDFCEEVLTEPLEEEELFYRCSFPMKMCT